MTDNTPVQITEEKRQQRTSMVLNERAHDHCLVIVLHSAKLVIFTP